MEGRRVPGGTEIGHLHLRAGPTGLVCNTLNVRAQWELRVLDESMAILRRDIDGEGDENQVSLVGPTDSPGAHLMINERESGGGGGGDRRGCDGGDIGSQCTLSREGGNFDSGSATSTSMPHDKMKLVDQHFFAKTVRSGDASFAGSRKSMTSKKSSIRCETSEEGSTIMFETLHFERHSYASSSFTASSRSSVGESRCQDPVNLTSLESLHLSPTSVSLSGEIPILRGGQ